jgi:hypothetical protein
MMPFLSLQTPGDVASRSDYTDLSAKGKQEKSRQETVERKAAFFYCLLSTVYSLRFARPSGCRDTFGSDGKSYRFECIHSWDRKHPVVITGEYTYKALTGKTGALRVVTPRQAVSPGPPDRWYGRVEWINRDRMVIVDGNERYVYDRE